MRRALIHLVGVLVLAAGPALPYYHLTTSPHHFCPQHRVFEVGHRQPPQPSDPLDDRSPDDSDRDGDREHKDCPLATLILQLVNHRQAGTTLAQQSAPRLDRPAAPLHLPLHRERDVTTMAPKTSPPSLPYV